MKVDPCSIDGAWPFEHVTITRLNDDQGEPNGLVEIEATREGSAPWVTIPYERLWQQMEVHQISNHGKSLSDVTSFEELEHATIRAAVVFLMD